jgi:hypothetical protein
MDKAEILNIIQESNIKQELIREITEHLGITSRYTPAPKTGVSFPIHYAYPLVGMTHLTKDHYFNPQKRAVINSVEESETPLFGSRIRVGASTGVREGDIITPINISDSTPEQKLEQQTSDTLKNTVQQLNNEIYHIKKTMELLKSSIEKLSEENNLVKEILYSEATSFSDSKAIQKLPVEIYLDTNEPSEIFKLYGSVLDFIKIIGFDKSLDFEAMKGSWFKRLIALSSEKLSSEEVKNRLKEAEYGIEVNTILKQQSEIDKNQSEALANIITSLKDIPNAAIRIGALIVVKVTDSNGTVNLQTRTLSIKELHLLNKKPELLKIPQQILQALAEEIKDDIPPSIED